MRERRERSKTYAETPIFSNIEAVETIASAVVKPNLYSQAWTGCVPAWAIALVNVVT
jgi:hypothetical protein